MTGRAASGTSQKLWSVVGIAEGRAPKPQESEARQKVPPKEGHQMTSAGTQWAFSSAQLASSPLWGASPALTGPDFSQQDSTRAQTGLVKMNQAGQIPLHQTKGQSSRESHDSTFMLRSQNIKDVPPGHQISIRSTVILKMAALDPTSGVRFTLWVNHQKLDIKT